MTADAPDVVRVDPALSPARVADLLSVTTDTLYAMRTAGRFPAADFTMPGRGRHGRSPRWRASTVQRWLDEQQRGER